MGTGEYPLGWPSNCFLGPQDPYDCSEGAKIMAGDRFTTRRQDFEDGVPRSWLLMGIPDKTL